MPEDRIRILLADDHVVVREGLKALIRGEADMEVVGEAGDGLSVAKLAQQLHPHVVVMDITMPDLNGAQATILIKKSLPDVRILALTAHAEKSYVRQLLEAGASGYVLKASAANELVGAIRRVAHGGTYIDPGITDTVIQSFVRRGAMVPHTPLSDREAEVLRLIARGHANKEIAALLDVSVKTVETYRRRLMEKLNLNTRVDIVRYAISQGWLNDE
jgi:DNA-binding NarL/FixJ family response regulator